MADEEDSEPEVFEIEDFTTASEWERFIAKLEEIIGAWHLDNSQKNTEKKDSKAKEKTISSKASGQKEDFENEWKIQTNQLSFADFDFTLSHHKLSTNSSNIADSDGKTGDSDERPSTAVLDMFDMEFDFPSRAHCIARWHGLKEFLILSPSNPNEDITTESKTKLLLSSLSVSLSNTHCHVPAFVQVQQRWRRLFFGTCIFNGFSTSFEMACLRSVPPQCNHLSGLLDVFKSKLAISERLIPPVMASVRFTYILRLPDTKFEQQLPDFSTSEGGYLNLSRQPFGPLQEPISELHLATTWPCLSEETFVDHAEYTDLNPIEAPKWLLRARPADKCVSRLHDHLLAFLQICKAPESTAQIIRSLSNDETDLDSYGDITQAFNKLTKTGSTSSLGKSSNVKKPNNREQRRLKESPIPAELLNTILLHLFPDSHEDMEQAEERQTILASEQEQIEIDGKKDKFRKLKSAPEKSLLSLMTICLSIVNHSNGGVKAFAHLWHEFVLEMRYRYENNIIIPRIALTRPNLNYCLIHQKLQMLNHCIQRKKINYEQSSQPISGSCSPTSLPVKEDNTTELNDSEKDTFNRWVEFDSESGSDEEFFEAVEEQHVISTSASSPAVDITECEKNTVTKSVENSPSETMISDSKSNDDDKCRKVERSGVLEESSLKLLETGETLCIPVTQEQPVMTEDMLEEHTEIILKLSKSEDGSKYLTQMQSLLLFSDVQSFKAANPGCIFEDFVRWYSPNDWIAGPETEREKEDLQNMRAHLQKSNEKDLSEIVGEGEVDGWDLEADEQITEEEISSLISNPEDENQPKLLEDGHLSVRMRIPGNIWLETWHTARPSPARRQKRLFDYTKEAEKVLHFLANLKPSEIATLLFPVFITTAVKRISLENESSRPRISKILSQIIDESSRISVKGKDEVSKMMAIARQIQIAELAISRIQYLQKHFSKLASKDGNEEDIDEDNKTFVSELLSKPEVEINGGPNGRIGALIKGLIENDKPQDVQRNSQTSTKTLSEIIREPQGKELSFPPPAGREYILRTSIKKPKQYSRPCPQRMFTVITPDEMRLATAVSRDSTFI